MKPSLRVALVASLLFIHGVVPLVAQDATTRLEGEPEEIGLPSSDWYGIYAQGKKIGYACIELLRDETLDHPAYVVKSRFSMKLTAAGGQMEMQIDEAYYFEVSPPHAFLWGTMTIKQGPYEQQVTATRTGSELEAKIVGGGEEREMTVPAPDYTLMDDLTPYLWFRAGPQEGESLTFLTFELEELQTEAETMLVVDIKETLVEGVQMTCYEVEMSGSRSGELGTAFVDAQGNLLSATLGGLFELRMEPEELARQTQYSADLFVFGLAKTDRPLGDPTTVAQLVIEVTGEGASSIGNAPYQSVSENPQGEGIILRLGPGCGEPFRATPEQLEENLAETVDYPTRHEKTLAWLEGKFDEGATPREKVRCLVQLVDTFIEDSYTAEPLTVLDLLSAKKGDCSEHAALFTTLARAAGIPCREITGLAYAGDEMQAFGWHAWNEVVLDGVWVPVDPTWGETDVDATHIRFSSDDERSGEQLLAYGNLQFRIVELQRRE